MIECFDVSGWLWEVMKWTMYAGCVARQVKLITQLSTRNVAQRDIQNMSILLPEREGKKEKQEHPALI